MFFSVHCERLKDPVYISEVAYKTMNPSFQSFDLKMYGPLVTRREDLQIKIWIKAAGVENWTLLVDLTANLRSLQFVGKTVSQGYQDIWEHV